MNLSRPHEGILSNSIAEVIRALSVTGTPVSGRGLARRTSLSTGQVNQTLMRLQKIGVVGFVPQPPAKLYQLNPTNILTQHLVALVTSSEEVSSWISSRLRDFEPRCSLAVIFGSFARGDAGADSDVDLYLAWGDQVFEATSDLDLRISEIASSFYEVFGNELNTVIVKMSEVEASFKVPGRFEQALVADGIAVVGAELFKELKEPRIEFTDPTLHQ